MLGGLGVIRPDQFGSWSSDCFFCWEIGWFLLFLGKSGVIRWPNCCDLGFSAVLCCVLYSLWLGSLGFRIMGALMQTSPRNVDSLILENFSPCTA
jgi:hypothetical protein